jgi:hypothetical protein
MVLVSKSMCNYIPINQKTKLFTQHENFIQLININSNDIFIQYHKFIFITYLFFGKNGKLKIFLFNFYTSKIVQ